MIRRTDKVSISQPSCYGRRIKLARRLFNDTRQDPDQTTQVDLGMPQNVQRCLLKGAARQRHAQYIGGRFFANRIMINDAKYQIRDFVDLKRRVHSLRTSGVFVFELCRCKDAVLRRAIELQKTAGRGESQGESLYSE